MFHNSIGLHPILTYIALSGLFKVTKENIKALKGRYMLAWGEIP
jgi:hypothetical protein